MLGKSWTRDELLIAMKLYSRIPYGRIHKGNPEIIALATALDRTVGSVVMKLTNFASFDPTHQARNVSGLKNASRADKALWDEFVQNPEQFAFESENAFQHLISAFTEVSATKQIVPLSYQTHSENKSTEAIYLLRTRLVQRFFRDAVLASYGFRCAICYIGIVELLNAGHIIPWSHNVKRRADPTNGLCLCALHDRAFDRGLITVDDALEVVLSPILRERNDVSMLQVGFIEYEGRKIDKPNRFAPDLEALRYHRLNVFRNS